MSDLTGSQNFYISCLPFVQEKHIIGTIVTTESFEKWRQGFMKEVEAQREVKDAAERAAKKGRLTGKTRASQREVSCPHHLSHNIYIYIYRCTYIDRYIETHTKTIIYTHIYIHSLIHTPMPTLSFNPSLLHAHIASFTQEILSHRKYSYAAPQAGSYSREMLACAHQTSKKSLQVQSLV